MFTSTYISNTTSVSDIIELERNNQINQEIEEVNKSLLQEAIDFFSIPKFNKTFDSERYFFKRSEWEYVISKCNPAYIKPYIMYDECGEIWGFAIAPMYFKSKRNKTSKKNKNN